jgi:membrane fusion protein (multidrug efflux system)
MLNKYVILLPILVIIVACRPDVTPTKDKHIDVMTIKLTTAPYMLDYPGTVAGVADFPVISRVNGVILEQLYKEGTLVHKGESLYQIDPRPFQNDLRAYQGQLLKDQNAAAQYKNILNRYNSLYESGGVSLQDIEVAKVNYMNAVGLVQTDQANIAQALLNLQYCNVTAPVTGLIAERLITVGDTVQAFTTVLNYINSAESMYVNFSVPENDRLELLRNVREHKITVPANYKFALKLQLSDGSIIDNIGYVNFLDTRISLQNGTWSLRGDIYNKSSNLLSGQYVHIYLLGAKYVAAILVPQLAIFRDEDGFFVYIVSHDKKALKRKISVGKMIEQFWIVESGLTPGDKIVVNGGIKLSPNDTIVIDQES